MLPVTIPILSFDPRIRGVVRGATSVSFVIRAYLSELFDYLVQPAYFDKLRPGLATVATHSPFMPLLFRLCAKCSREGAWFR